VGGLEKGHGLGGQGKKPRQGTYRKNDGVVGTQGVGPGGTGFLEEAGSDACASEKAGEKIFSLFHMEGPLREIDMKDP